MLAANRGWIGPAERVLIGAVASALVFGAGLAVRARYGQLLAALAAVAPAGGCLRDARGGDRTVRPGARRARPASRGPDRGVDDRVALAWGSQILAGIGLVGSALAPALQAIDTGMTPASAAFAVIASRRRPWWPRVDAGSRCS